MKKLVIFDGNSIVNRAFYGVRLLSSTKGVFTNAIFGFMNILLKYINSESPDYLVIAFDLKKPTFRHKVYAEYKAGRHAMPDELAMQIPILKDILSAMNISMLSYEGYEADDLIGTVSDMCENAGIDCIIATGDRDSLQLAGERTSIYLTSTKGGNTITDIMTPDAVFEKYGVTPAQMIDVKGLMGDSSDNIPGVKGIGEKTACSLISTYGSIDAVYENIESMKGAVKTKLETDRDMAYLSRSLVTIDRHVPITETFEDFLVKPYDNDGLFEILSELELKSLITKLNLTVPETAVSASVFTPANVPTVIINNNNDASMVVDEITSAKYFAYKIFTQEKDIRAISVLTSSKHYFFSIGEGLLATLDIEMLLPIFSCDAEKFTHSCKEDTVSLYYYNTELKNVRFDTSLAAYIADPARSSYDPGSLCGFETEEEIFGKGKKRLSPSDIDIDTLCSYGHKVVSAILYLKNEYTDFLTEHNQLGLFYDIELPFSSVLADMEIYGFKVDSKSLRDFGASLSETINLLEQTIYDIAGEKFNINSTQQLGAVLFDKLGLPVIRKTKRGYSTDSDVLDRLQNKHEIIEYIKNYRMLSKLKSTYVDGMIPLISPSTGRIYSKFNQTVTATGRISSTEPNLQNIPVRTEIGRELRKMFVAQDSDYILIDADYSQIELRILAHISGDPVLIDAFKNGDDIHSITASQVFDVPLWEVTPTMRRNAKAVNFGIVYGISEFALAGDLSISRKMAKEYMDSYFEKYSKVKEYMENIIEFAKTHGYVETILSRRRYIPEIRSKKFAERSFGERVALNAPIQGSAADIIKIAMINVHKNLRGMKSRLILQVHDELIIEAHKSELEEVRNILKTNMENAVELSIPLDVDINEGVSWYDAK